LLDDLEQHLHEVAAEEEGTLTDRLGPPAAYAAELRLSAGLPPTPARPRIRSSMSSRLQRSVHRLRSLPGGAATLDFMRELRPGWWVLRGYLFVVAMSIVFTHTVHWFPSGDRAEPLVGLVAVVAAVVGSVALGRAAPSKASLRRLAILLNVGVVFIGLVAVGHTKPIGGSEHIV